MSKARKNRAARRKRDKKHMQQLVEKRLTKQVYKDFSVNPEYYQIVWRGVESKGTDAKGRRKLVVSATVRQNQKYKDLLARLMKLCEGLTVNIRREEDE